MSAPQSGAMDALFFTPNPCIERTLAIADFARGASHRVNSADLRVTAGGKGINAARVARNFGARVRVLAPIGRGQIAQFRALLAQDELPADLVEVAPDTRIAINIVHDGGFTEIVEAGRALSSADGDTMTARFLVHLANCSIAIIGGSYPPANLASARGHDWHSHAATLCAMAATANVKVLYDGKGEAFERAVNSANPPWAIKPNLDEASQLLKRDLQTPDAQSAAVAELMARGVEVVLLSCGARGLWLGSDGQIEWIRAPTIEEISPVGSGDSLVGAFVAKCLQSGDIYQAARWGVAAGSANAARLNVARVGPHDAQQLMGRD